MMRYLLQLTCILALLAAQHGALTHAVWHVYESLPAQAQAHGDHEHDDAGDGRSPQADLCGLHLLLGTVLGCAGASTLQFHTPPAAVEAGLHQLHPRQAADALLFFIRGPPTLS